MSSNCTAAEPWPQDNRWISKSAAAIETEALTKALSGDSDAISSFLLSFDPVKPEPADSAIGPDSGPERTGRPTIAGAQGAGRIKKRKSRAKKQSQTTYITTDPDNFRRMVQRYTGFPIGPADPVLKPQTQRPRPGNNNRTDAPSAFLLDRDTAAGPMCTTFGSFEPGAMDGLGFELDPIQSYYPTLESWKVM